MSREALTLLLYVSARSLLINIQSPFPPLLAFLHSHKHSWMIFFTSNIFSVLHMPCLSPLALLFTHCYSLSLPISLYLCDLSLSSSYTLKKYSGAFVVHYSTHTTAFLLLSSNGYSVKEGGSCIYGLALFTINSHSSPGRSDKWNSSHSNLSFPFPFLDIALMADSTK